MGFIQTYAKEIFALLVPFVTWLLNNRLRARAKLIRSVPHQYIFLVNEPLRNDAGDIIQPKQAVHTVSHVISNSGRETATQVEVVLNWKPLSVNIWPSRHFKTHTEEDGRYVLIFDSLSPNEQIGLELLSVNADLPALVNVRSDQCAAKEIAMYPQPILPAWQRRSVIALFFAGIAFSVYVATLLLQFLLLASPFGH